VIGEALARRGFPFQRRAHSRLAEMPGVNLILAALPSPLLDEASPEVCDLVAAAVTAALRTAADSEAAAPGTGVTPANGAGSKNAATGKGGRGAVTDADRERSEALAAIKAAGEVLTPLAARCGADLDRFLDELALGAEVDTWDPRADRISLLTLHAAKGLEFPVVFIAGCDDGLLPLRSWRGAEVDYAEERRLLFVGMTRATTRLTLLTAARRVLRGEPAECSPSPFLSSVDHSLLDRNSGKPKNSGRRKPQAQQPTLF
jgi:DNA helicase-2/ATP-dependent DNA helicase PcrA